MKPITGRQLDESVEFMFSDKDIQEFIKLSIMAMVAFNKCGDMAIHIDADSSKHKYVERYTRCVALAKKRVNACIKKGLLHEHFA